MNSWKEKDIRMKRVENFRKLKTMIKWYINDYADISKACDYFFKCDQYKGFITSSVECCEFEYHTHMLIVLKINDKLNIMRL